jgi:hypothetical protein
MSPRDWVCGSCGARGRLSSSAAMILVWAPRLERPYPLIPLEEYRVCMGCDAIRSLVEKAVAAHPALSAAGRWTTALIVFDAGDGYTIRQDSQSERPTQSKACA